jgi:penicillin-binding protein 1A
MPMTDTHDNDASHASGSLLLRVLAVFVALAATVTVGGIAGVIGAYYYVAPSLPKAETIRDIPLEIPLRIFSRDGALISEIGQRRRVLVSYDEVPEHVVQAFIAAEDRRFFEHPGLDYRGILRAAFQWVTTGNVESGGSTLTQQLARSYFLNLDQTLDRKFKEAALAVRIEQLFTKEEIMELFLNKMFFGQRAYGVAAAAQVFFDKRIEDLDISEAATLAGVLPAPSRYNPVRSPENATRRRGYVLGRMETLGFISREEYAAANDTPMESELHGADVELEADYVAEMVRREMLNRYGEATYTAGYQVVTTLDSRLQRAATYALRNGLLEFTRRRGYRGPIKQLDIDAELLAADFSEWPGEILDDLEQYAPGGLKVALVIGLDDERNAARIVFADGAQDRIPWRGLSWAKPFMDRTTTGPEPKSVTDVLAVGDLVYVMPTTAGTWALAQVPEAQSAVVSLDPDDGAITSLAGGFDFATSKFNRVTQAYRQPGSSFKPFIYSAALENGNTAATVVDDSPVVIRSSELEADWRPINYTGRFYGPTRLREALTRSMNLVSVRLLLYETGVGNAVEHIRKFGFPDAALPYNGSLALGGGNATPLDMVQGYAVLANGGFAVKPYVIDAIFGADGEALYRAEPLVVCRECEIDDDPFRRDDETEMTLEEMADVALSYRPDANTAPDLFADVKAAPRAISEQNAFLIQDMMRDVVRRGTGRRAMQLGRNDLSGKTGTSNDRRDAWFGGFNADLAAIVWVGYDDDVSLGPGEEGSRTALPIWIEFARIAFDGVPNHKMPMPQGIVSRKINRQTGCPASATDRDTMFEYFREGHVPECEDVQELPKIFDTGVTSSDDEEDAEEPESLF